MVNKQKILIVDDDANIAELISLYLTKECFDTMIVEDGESALRAVDTFALTVRKLRREGKNPIGAADLKWIFARNCEGTEQLQ